MLLDIKRTKHKEQSWCESRVKKQPPIKILLQMKLLSERKKFNYFAAMENLGN